MVFLNFVLTFFGLELLSGDGASTGGLYTLMPGIFGGNGSIHSVRHARFCGRRFRVHRRINVPVGTAGPMHDGKFRAGNFRFATLDAAVEALMEARSHIVVTEQGAFVALNVPAYQRVHAADNPPFEVQLAPPPGEVLTLEM